MSTAWPRFARSRLIKRRSYARSPTAPTTTSLLWTRTAGQRKAWPCSHANFKPLNLNGDYWHAATLQCQILGFNEVSVYSSPHYYITVTWTEAMFWALYLLFSPLHLFSTGDIRLKKISAEMYGKKVVCTVFWYHISFTTNILKKSPSQVTLNRTVTGSWDVILQAMIQSSLCNKNNFQESLSVWFLCILTNGKRINKDNF